MRDELTKAGFTITGKTRYEETLEDYANKLLEKSVKNGKVDQAKNYPLEITHEHVRQAAHSLANSFGKKKLSGWNILAHIGEYVFTAAAGIGGGNITESWGQITFGVSLSLAVILIVFRLINLNK